MTFILTLPHLLEHSPLLPTAELEGAESKPHLEILYTFILTSLGIPEDRSEALVVVSHNFEHCWVKQQPCLLKLQGNYKPSIA